MLIDLDYKTVTIDEDNGITIDMKPVDSGSYGMLVKQMRSIFKIQQNLGDSENAQVEMGMAQLESPELIEVSTNILPKYCSNLKGIQIKENNSTREATIEDLIKTSAGLTLCIRIISELFAISTASEKDAEEVKKQ